MNAPHRHARTYGLIDAADEALIAPYAASIGAVAVVATGAAPTSPPGAARTRPRSPSGEAST